MKKFKDLRGREWPVRITYGTADRVREQLDVELLDVADGGLIRRLNGEPSLILRVVYLAIKTDCDAAGVSEQDFRGAMGGDELDAATDALLEALVDFFPGGGRPILRQVLQKTRELEALLVAETMRVVETLSTATPSNVSAGGSPENSASQPDPDPSASASSR